MIRILLKKLSEYTTPSAPSGGIDDFEYGEMKDLRMVHHCLEDKESDFNLFAMLS